MGLNLSFGPGAILVDESPMENLTDDLRHLDTCLTQDSQIVLEESLQTTPTQPPHQWLFEVV